MEASKQTQSILVFMILLLWQCLSMSPESITGPAFALKITSYTVAAELMTPMSINFVPGLLDVLQSSTPPTVAFFFKSLPTLDSLGPGIWWVVYQLVLEKPGHRPIIYTGSGTDAKDGAVVRLRCYDRRTHLPIYVDAALKNGYTITHKGILCWIPCPGLLLQFMYRLIFVALEATFSFVFWTMRCSTEYGFRMAELCPWSRESLEYDGACGHSALMETPRGDPDLTPEQAKEKELRAKQKDKERWARSYENNKENKLKSAARYREENKEAIAENKARYYQENRDTLNEASWNRRQVPENAEQARLTSKAWYEEHRELVSKEGVKKRQADKEAGKWSCDICDQTFSTSGNLKQHTESEKHMQAVGLDEAAIKAVLKYRCDPCNYRTAVKRNLTAHLTTLAHKKKTRDEKRVELKS